MKSFFLFLIFFPSFWIFGDFQISRCWMDTDIGFVFFIFTRNHTCPLPNFTGTAEFSVGLIPRSTNHILTMATLRGIFPEFEESTWMEAVSSFDNQVPRFRTKEEALEFTKTHMVWRWMEKLLLSLIFALLHLNSVPFLSLHECKGYLFESRWA